MDRHVSALVRRVRQSQLPVPSERKQIRLRAGLSTRDVATALGVDAMSVNRWENGTVRPRLEHAIAYRELLDALKRATS